MLSTMPLSVPCFITFPSPFHYWHATFSSALPHPSGPRSAFPVHVGHQTVWRRNHWTPSHVWPHPPGWRKLSCSTWQNNTNTYHMNRIQSHKVLYNFSICQEFPTKVPEYVILHEVLHWLSNLWPRQRTWALVSSSSISGLILTTSLYFPRENGVQSHWPVTAC